MTDDDDGPRAVAKRYREQDASVESVFTGK